MNEEKLRRAFEGLYPDHGEWDWSHPNNPLAFESDGWPAYFGVKWQGFKSGHALGGKTAIENLNKKILAGEYEPFGYDDILRASKELSEGDFEIVDDPPGSTVNPCCALAKKAERDRIVAIARVRMPHSDGAAIAAAIEKGESDAS